MNRRFLFDGTALPRNSWEKTTARRKFRWLKEQGKTRKKVETLNKKIYFFCFYFSRACFLVSRKISTWLTLQGTAPTQITFSYGSVVFESGQLACFSYDQPLLKTWLKANFLHFPRNRIFLSKSGSQWLSILISMKWFTNSLCFCSACFSICKTISNSERKKKMFSSFEGSWQMSVLSLGAASASVPPIPQPQTAGAQCPFQRRLVARPHPSLAPSLPPGFEPRTLPSINRYVWKCDSSLVMHDSA